MCSCFAAGPTINAAGQISFTLAADASGVANLDVTCRDSGPGAAPSVNTSAQKRVVVTVNAVNDAPGFTAGGPVAAVSDGTATTVAGWATNITPGPADETLQTVIFEVTANDNPALFAAGPTVSANGTLSVTPSTGANGTAQVSLRVRDSGGTANGGVDVSAAQNVTITITPPVGAGP